MYYCDEHGTVMAFQYLSHKDIPNFVSEKVRVEHWGSRLVIDTGYGAEDCNIGDWVILSGYGDCAVCNNQIFQQRFSRVEVLNETSNGIV